MQRLKFAVGLMSLSIVTMIAGLLLSSTLVPLAMGWERVVLTSGSMLPLIDPGDIVLAAKAQHPVAPGTVIVFENPNKPGKLITHRVIENLPNGNYRTKGDANTQPDVSSVTQDMVLGRGVLLVPALGLPVFWLQQGYPALTVSAVALVLLLAWFSRYGLLRRHDPWHTPPVPDAPAPARRKRTAPAVGAAVLITALAGAAIWFAPNPAQGAHTAATANSGNQLTTASATSGVSYFLKASGTTNSTSTPVLPLSPTTPTLAALPNYDTNRDDKPGLLLTQGTGLAETDPAKVQRWMMPQNSPVSLAGNVRVTLWSAMKDFNTTAAGSVTVGLYDCNNGGNNCFPIGTPTTVTSNSSWSGGSSTWVAKEFNLGSINNLTATRLELRVAVTGNSSDAMIFAYDTTTHPSRITVGG